MNSMTFHVIADLFALAGIWYIVPRLFLLFFSVVDEDEDEDDEDEDEDEDEQYWW